MFCSEYGRWTALVLFAAAACVQLFVPFDKRWTKPLLLPLIAVYYLFSVTQPDWILVAALLFSGLGDALLMPNSNKWFTAGGISFMLSHFLFIAVYARHMDFSAVPRLPSVLIALVYLCVTAVILRLVQPISPKAMTAAVCAYLLANSCMNVFSAMHLLSAPCLGSGIAYVGAVLFFISDCLLFLVRYDKSGRLKSYFFVMLTYIVGEFLIAEGMILLYR